VKYLASLTFVLLFPWLCWGAVVSDQASISCINNDQIRSVVSQLGHADDNYDFHKDFEVLGTAPAVAACYLVKALRVIREIHIAARDKQKHGLAMHVIWSIRALRYLTGGLDFTGRTEYKFKESEKQRKYFLTQKGVEQLPFFSVWMSRDAIYIAPPDAQTEIIDKWLRWYSENGETFHYEPSQSIDQWYF